MLKTVTKSANKKLGGCAATYRSGHANVYNTCPSSCSLMPAGNQGSEEIDQEYLEAVINAVPEGGVSWTYSHFERSKLPKPGFGTTVINFSADSYEEAVESIKDGYPTVVAVPADRDSRVEKVSEIRFVRCPAEYNEKVTCLNCGGGEPLCARSVRDFVVKFTAHGSQAKKVGTEVKGGCYGSGGMVAIQWKGTMKAEQEVSDAEKLTAWVKTLPYGTFVRHHVVGDIGSESIPDSK